MRARVVAQFLCSTERSSSRVMHKNLRPVNLCIHRGHQFAPPPPQKKKNKKNPSGTKFFRTRMTSCPYSSRHMASSRQTIMYTLYKLQPEIWSVYQPLFFKVCVQISVLRVVWNIEKSFVLSVLKHACRNTSSFELQDKHGVLLWLVPSSAGFT